MRERVVSGLRRLMVALSARMWTAGVEDFVLSVVRRRSESLSPDESLRFLFRVGDRIDGLLDLKALEYDRGVHPKHRLTRYHDFFVDRILSGERVLDVGCGNGAVTCDIAARAGADVVGIDLSEANITEAQRRHAHPRVRYVTGDVLSEVPKGSFDVVVLSNVLEHLFGRVDFLKGLREVTGAGRMLLRVPVIERDWRVPLRGELGLEWRCDLTHETEYTLESFAVEMYEAGLIVRYQESRWGEIWAEAVPLTMRRAAGAIATQPKVCYAHPGFPAPVSGLQMHSAGGAVKYQYLNRAFPHSFPECDILYAVSSAYRTTPDLLKAARDAGVRVVWNQNGTYVPWAYEPQAMAEGNRRMAELYHLADHVLYQSEYCRRTAEHYLGPRSRPGEILYNAVDADRFTPGTTRSAGLTLLLCGSHDDPYRAPRAIETLAAVRRSRKDARLIIAGTVRHPQQVQQKIQELRVADYVDFIGAYTQETAAEVYRRAHILLHTKFNDPCPTVVLEAMACGLPVVYSASGGVPELVGTEAGVGVPAPAAWDDVKPPDPEELACGVLSVAADLARFREAARQRAVARFDQRAWLKRHAEVFQMLMDHDR